MPFAREIFIRIKQVIRFQQSNKEADSHYTLLGNTLVRISNHCTHMKVWDNYFNENPKMKGKPIVSLVFEDNGNTFTEECLFSNGNRRRPLKISEYVFESSQLTKQDINLIIKSLQNLGKSNSFIDLTKRGTSYNRISVCPDFNNIEITNDGLPRKGGIKGTDFVPESKQYDNNNNENKDMKRTNKIRLTESQLHQVIKESVKKVMKEGKGKFTQLYNDTKSPHNYSKTIESLLNEYIAVENEYQRKMLNIEKDLEMYTNWSWDEFCEYAEEKYGLTRDNMEKNWDKFAPDTFEFRTRVH